MQVSKNKLKSKFSIFNSVILVLLIAYAFILFFALYWMITASLKTETEIAIDNFFGLPKEWLFSNFSYALQVFEHVIPTGDVIKLLPTQTYEGLDCGIIINTLLYTVGGAFCASIVPCFVGYVVAKFNYKFSKLLYGVVIITMILPIVGNYPSMVNVMYKLNIYDTFLGNWLQKANFLGMYFLIFYAAFKSLPNDYMEAAYIDGASEWRVLLRIMFPLVKTIFLTIMVIHFVDIWNDYQTVLLYLPSHPTISFSVFMKATSTDTGSARTEIKMASCMVMVIPTVLIFIIFKDKLMGNLSMGGIKG
ncbi:MAG: carbohydrate ABC transporter permease [Clostridia bacterium]|nr:carbohydrate ABC transporter permease [Clostridia bacterium]